MKGNQGTGPIGSTLAPRRIRIVALLHASGEMEIPGGHAQSEGKWARSFHPTSCLAPSLDDHREGSVVPSEKLLVGTASPGTSLNQPPQLLLGVNLSFAPTSCVTWGKPLDFSVPQFPYL